MDGIRMIIQSKKQNTGEMELQEKGKEEKERMDGISRRKSDALLSDGT